MPSRAARPSLPPLAIPPAMCEVTGFLMNVLAERLRDVTQDMLDGTGVRPRQIGLLLVLRDEGEVQQQQLGERLGMDRTTTMQLVCALESEGIVDRAPDPRDGRAYLLRLTPRGDRLAQRVDHLARAAASEVLSALSAAEAVRLQRLLRKALGATS